LKIYIFQRIVLAIISLFIIISITFLLMASLPGQFGIDEIEDPVIREMMIARYGLDRPIHERYFIYLRGIITQGDLGVSTTLYPRWDVAEIILGRMPITLQLNFFASLLVYPIGLGLGIIMALKKDTYIDTSLNVFVVVFISVPVFVVAALMQYFLAFRLELFPLLLSVWRPNDWAMSWEKFHSMILPILALSFGGIMNLARSMRGELAESLTSDFMLLAKSKGLSHKQATMRHALRNAFLPMTGIVISTFVFLLSGSLFIERQFGIPGLGGLLIRAIQVVDIPVALGWMMIFTTINLISILITDILYGVVDPRVRIGGKRDEY